MKVDGNTANYSKVWKLADSSSLVKSVLVWKQKDNFVNDDDVAYPMPPGYEEDDCINVRNAAAEEAALFNVENALTCGNSSDSDDN